MPKKVSSAAEIERNVYTDRQRRFAMRSRTGWDQALEAEVADLIVGLLRGENINTGLDPRIKADLAAEGKKGMLLSGNDPALKIHVGGREVSGDGIAWVDGRQESAMDPYIYLASADQKRREHGLYETARLTAPELAEGVGVPADEEHVRRLTTVLYKLRDVRRVIRDDDDRWRAAEPGTDTDKLTPTSDPLTDGQKAVWDALEYTALTAKEIAGKIDNSEGGVRQFVAEIKRSGRKIENRSGRGYWRPDAPPSER